MIYGYNNFGYEGSLIGVEVDLRRGIPAVDIVGLSDGQVKESRERMREAIRNSRLDFPPERVLIALSPADMKKDGMGFTFPMALAVIAEQEMLNPGENVIAIGNVHPSGTLHNDIGGGLAALQTAAKNGIKFAIVPEDFPNDIKVEGIQLVKVKNLMEAAQCYNGIQLVSSMAKDPEKKSIYDAIAKTNKELADFLEEKEILNPPRSKVRFNGKEYSGRIIYNSNTGFTMFEDSLNDSMSPYLSWNTVSRKPSEKTERLIKAAKQIDINIEFYIPKKVLELPDVMALDWCRKNAMLTEPQKEKAVEVDFPPSVRRYEAGSEPEPLDKIEGHKNLKMAIATAIAGGHSILAIGAPGCGKSVILNYMPTLMPALSEKEKKESARIHSIAGLYEGSCIQEGERPFRMPHQTATIEGMCGGGTNVRPGEISLAHNGVLFLDEAAEFKSSVLQMLRVPLESKQITLNRAGRTTIYPAKFQLAMAMNPCPCGNYSGQGKCLCSTKTVNLYWKKISQPLLDRIAVKVRADRDDKRDILAAELRKKIKVARTRQLERQGKLNNDLSPDEIKKFVHFNKDTERVLSNMQETYNWSQRDLMNVMRLSRTIEDMGEGRDVISRESVDEAIKMYDSLPNNAIKMEPAPEMERSDDDGWGY